MAYLGNGPGVASQRITDTFSVSTTTTTFTPSAGYTVGYLDVYHNGVKLVNGDEIIAKIVSDDGMSYTIDRPCTVVPSAQGIGLIQSLFTSDVKKPVTISKQHVMIAGE